MSIYDMMESAARLGFYYYSSMCILEHIEELEDNKFLVLFPHTVTWFHTPVLSEYTTLESILDLDENNPQYSLCEKLWVISSKARALWIIEQERRLNEEDDELDGY